MRSTRARVERTSHTSLARALVWLLWIRETTAWDRCNKPQGGICALGRGMATGAATITTLYGSAESGRLAAVVGQVAVQDGSG